MKLSICLLLALAAGGCAAPSAESPPGMEDNSASKADAATEGSASFPRPAATESPAELPLPSATQESGASVQTIFDPDGLSIGPGSGFVVLDNPAVIPGEQATWLAPDELVLGVTVGDEARAYPISQMAYHHIANDQIGGEPYLVTY